jgi:hypothetical protein
LYCSLIKLLYRLKVRSITEVRTAFARDSWVTIPSIPELSATGIRFIWLSRIRFKACLTVPFGERVTIGEVMIDFRKTWSESSPLITTLSIMSLSVTIPTGMLPLDAMMVAAL